VNLLGVTVGGFLIFWPPKSEALFEERIGDEEAMAIAFWPMGTPVLSQTGEELGGSMVDEAEEEECPGRR